MSAGEKEESIEAVTVDMGKHTERNKRRRNVEKGQKANAESPERGPADGRALLLEGMRATFVAPAGPGGSATPAEAQCMLGAAIERVVAGEPSFRSGRYMGSYFRPPNGHR